MKSRFFSIPLMAALPFGAAAADFLPPTTDLRIGHPTIEHKLFYRKVHERLPFADARICYYDNGVYRIVSAGEEHYGMYVVVRGRLTDDSYAVQYASLPSSERRNKTPHHCLTFDRKAGTFQQQAAWEDDPDIAPRQGLFSQAENPVNDPETIKRGTRAYPQERS
jgi:hypothetical protein